MDPLTHFMTGACLGRAGFNRKTAYATLAMTLAAEAPDMDMVGYLGGPVSGFSHHRGITHTFVGAPFMALLVTGMLWFGLRIRDSRRQHQELRARMAGKPVPERKAAAGPPVRWLWIWFLCLLADLSHLLLDFTNTYGLRPLFPWNPHWFAWGIVPIFSPVLFVLLLMGLAIPALLGLVEGEMHRRKRGELHGRGWAVAALLLIAATYGVRGWAQRNALADARAATGTVPYSRMVALPGMVNPFSWRVLGQTADGYRAMTVHSLSGTVEGSEFIPFPRRTEAVEEAMQRSYLGGVYMDWSSWPVVEDMGGAQPVSGDPVDLPPDAATVRFRDLRFAPASLGQLATDAGDTPLSGYVVISSSGGILGQWMSGSRQR